MNETGDHLHRQFKRYLIYEAAGMVGLLISVDWVMLSGTLDDWADAATFHRLILRLSICGLIFLFLLAIIGNILRILWKVKKDPKAYGAFNDEFHDQSEKKAALFAFVATLMTLGGLLATAGFIPALSAGLAVQIALVVSVLSFVGSYLYFER